MPVPRLAPEMAMDPAEAVPAAAGTDPGLALMPVVTHSYIHFQPPPGPPPGSPAAPTRVTSVTRDAGATISFLPGSPGAGGTVTSWTVTPRIGGTPQAPQVIAAASATTITGSDGNTYTQVPVTSLANGTAYTFTVHGTNSAGYGTESAPSGANTPYSGLVFGDDFNGPAGQNLDPEWYTLTQCGYLKQNQCQYYTPECCVLDGSSNLLLTGKNVSYTGPRYPSDPAYPGSITQPWQAGCCISNTKTWAPSPGNTMTFESRLKPCPDIEQGMWPGLFWLFGQSAMPAWKTDPELGGWNTSDHAEVDIDEWPEYTSATNYMNNTYGDTADQYSIYTPGIDLTADLHVYSWQWKPGVSSTFFRDGTQTHQCTTSGIVATSACRYILLLQLQIYSWITVTTTQSCVIDYVRIYDQNLG